MALYEYRCPECTDEFELMRSMSEADAPAECPECGEPAGRVPSSFVTLVGRKQQHSLSQAGPEIRFGNGGCCGGGCGCG
jgi:putative FmdB family regulatory protein